MGSDCGLMLLSLSITVSHIKYSKFRFEVERILGDDFFYLVKKVLPTFVEGSHAYQLIRKIQILKIAIKLWKETKDSKFGSSIAALKELLDIQQKLVLDPANNYLWMRENVCKRRFNNISRGIC